MSLQPQNGGNRLRHDESGLSMLEWLGFIAIIITVLAFIPAVRGFAGDIYDKVFNATDEDGVKTASGIALKGIAITVLSIVIFFGSVVLLLYTNLGKRLAFLITGAATTGWMVIGSVLFVLYAPRGLRPANFEGLNSWQWRIPAVALTVISLILFLMFVAALDRYEREEVE